MGGSPCSAYQARCPSKGTSTAKRAKARVPPPNLLRSSTSYEGGDLASTAVANSDVHAERVVTLVNQSLQLFIVANDENYALAA